jgi:hypothetical protein
LYPTDVRARQRAVAAGGAPSPDAERRRWFYTPTDHGGLTLGAHLVEYRAVSPGQ